nr:hypothetical protein BaRGS_030770 [Batillaria attramentaria]
MDCSTMTEGRNLVSTGAFFSEAEDIFHSIQDDSGEDFAGDGQQGDARMTMGDARMTMVRTLLGMDNRVMPG